MIRNILYFHAIAGLIWLSVTKAWAQEENSLLKFPDILNVKGIPLDAKDNSVYCFSDLGAWIGYGLPADNDPVWGFTGPLLMKNNTWLGPMVCTFSFTDAETGKLLNWLDGENRIRSFYPGILSQSVTSGSLSFRLELVFCSSRSAAIMIHVRNNGNQIRKVIPGINGRFWGQNLIPEKVNHGLEIAFENSGEFFRMDFKELGNILNIGFSNDSYSANATEPIEIYPGEDKHYVITHSYCFNKQDYERDSVHVAGELKSLNEMLMKTRDRWMNWFSQVKAKPEFANEKAYRTIPVKAIETLMTNWRSAGLLSKYDGMYPSYKRYLGFWAMDSWKHAFALADFAPQLAKDQILGMYDLQDSLGMIADVINFNGSVNWRNTKPPISGWAVWEVFEKTRDFSFLEVLYPKLYRYHYWWYANRDHDRNGLCEWGSTDGTVEAAKWESGMDDGIRFDNRKMLRNNDNAYSIDLESVDLNSFLFAEKICLSHMAKILGKVDDEKTFISEAAALKKQIRDKMFDPQTGFFYDIDLQSKLPLSIKGNEGWVPLWAKVATPEQAQAVVKIMLDPLKFNSKIPFQSVSMDEKQFDPNDGYRGAVWLDQVYYGIAGLRNYGFEKEADLLTRKVFDHMEGLLNSSDPVWENYNPVTGQGLRASNFSWTASHLLLLYSGK
ncbi:MAG: trehalase family glycosidase [Mangrovibacterium sp.]